MTSPHWAEGSVAVVGVPAGGSWLHGAGRWAPSVCSWGELGCGVAPVPPASGVSRVPVRGVGPRQGLAGPEGPRLEG